jgi:hypothetical protein
MTSRNSRLKTWTGFLHRKKHRKEPLSARKKNTLGTVLYVACALTVLSSAALAARVTAIIKKHARDSTASGVAGTGGGLNPIGGLGGVGGLGGLRSLQETNKKKQKQRGVLLG